MARYTTTTMLVMALLVSSIVLGKNNDFFESTHSSHHHRFNHQFTMKVPTKQRMTTMTRTMTMTAFHSSSSLPLSFLSNSPQTRKTTEQEKINNCRQGRRQQQQQQQQQQQHDVIGFARLESTPSSSTSSAIDNEKEEDAAAENKLKDKNSSYILGLIENLNTALDKWIINGSMATRRRAFNIWQQIERESMDPELSKQAKRLITRASMPLDEPPPDDGDQKQQQQAKNTMNTIIPNDNKTRKEDANARKLWENMRQTNNDKNVQDVVDDRSSSGGGRSALSSRALNKNLKPDIFMPSLEKTKIRNEIMDPIALAKSKKELQDELHKKNGINPSSTTPNNNNNSNDDDSSNNSITNNNNNKNNNNNNNKNKNSNEEEIDRMDRAMIHMSKQIAYSGKAGQIFENAEHTMGIGGLDHVLHQIKRRIWVPLAAPPYLLYELGINPVRGLLLYGNPGCGKTLLARKIGSILSPCRPITVVSGPEVMDRFVGSSEANLRALFDNPPPIYDDDAVKTSSTDTADTADTAADIDALSKVALHVIVMDEFDAMARSRGGVGGRGNDQGDAGVARDSVVNQLLAKMDGIDPLVVPTLVIGLTNKRDLIEPALLRPGRFEVQIEVPPPKTTSQRVSILNVHMNHMFQAGRVLVRDAPCDTVASRRLDDDEITNKSNNNTIILTYEELLHHLANKCDGMSGASLAAVTRAAASHALERAVFDFTGNLLLSDQNNDDSSSSSSTSVEDCCLVTKEDFEMAIEDVLESGQEGKEKEEGNLSNEEK